MIEEIRRKIAEGQFEFSKHAVDQSILRKIRVQEIREAIAIGQVIENYPNDKYGASCLMGASHLCKFAPSSPNPFSLREKGSRISKSLSLRERDLG